MQKRLFVVLLVFSICVTGAFAQKGAAQSAGLEPLMAPGDLAITAGVGYGFFWGAIDVSGGVEFMLGKFMIADTIPLTWGVAAKAAFYKYSYNSDYYYSYTGAGGFGTLHLGLKDLNLPENMGWMANVDTYIGLGVGFYSWKERYYGSNYSDFKINIRTVGGVNYFFNDHIALNVEGGYYGGWGGGLIGILFKL